MMYNYSYEWINQTKTKQYWLVGVSQTTCTNEFVTIDIVLLQNQDVDT